MKYIFNIHREANDLLHSRAKARIQLLHSMPSWNCYKLTNVIEKFTKIKFKRNIKIAIDRVGVIFF